MVVVEEGEEPNDFCSLIGDKNAYHSLAKGKLNRRELTSFPGSALASLEPRQIGSFYEAPSTFPRVGEKPT